MERPVLDQSDPGRVVVSQSQIINASGHISVQKQGSVPKIFLVVIALGDTSAKDQQQECSDNNILEIHESIELKPFKIKIFIQEKETIPCYC